MSAHIIDGRSIAADIRQELRERVELMKAQGIRPGLAVVLVGNDAASMSYVAAKERDCKRVGILSRDIRLPASTSQDDLLNLIGELNTDDDIHGILVQLPLPGNLDEDAVIEAISPNKDIDGFHSLSIGNLVLNKDGFLPCTPQGVIQLIEKSGKSIEGADVVIIGRSRIVGTPLANMLFRKAKGGNATVTVCHSRTVNLAEKVRMADIVIAAAGSPNIVKADMVKPGAIVIDVGLSRVEDAQQEKGYRLVGDVDFNEVRKVAGSITPVPGGVGPMTRVMLLWNTLRSASRFIKA